MSKAEVIARSNIDKTYAYHLFLGDKKPSRDKVIALGFGFAFELEAFNNLLKYSGNRVLYPRDSRDSIIIFAISKKISIIDCNILLSDFFLTLL